MDTKTTKPPEKVNWMLLGFIVILIPIVFYFFSNKKAKLRKQQPEEQGVVLPEFCKAYFVWENGVTGDKRSVELDAEPGEQILIKVKKGTRTQENVSRLVSSRISSAKDDDADKKLELPGSIKVLKKDFRKTNHSRFQFSFMSSLTPFLVQLKQAGRLEQLRQGAKNDFETALNLLKWTRQSCPAGRPTAYPKWNALEIINMTRQGKTKAFCAQYSQIYVQACLSLGIPARYVGINNHELTEIWSNHLGKWVTIDPLYCCYFKHKAEVLNTLEIHDMLCLNKLAGVEVVRLLPELKYVKMKELQNYLDFSISLYTRQPLDNNPGLVDFQLIGKRRVNWVDRFTRSLPIYRQKSLVLMTNEKADLYFPVNTVEPKLCQVAPDRFVIELRTFAPNLKCIEFSSDGKNWRPSAKFIGWKVEKGKNSIAFRVLTHEGYRGPESSIELEYVP